MGLRLEHFQYDLPEELIAQQPAARREESRLMVLDRRSKTIRHSRFSELDRWLPRGGLLVVNDARVVPARLIGRRATGGRVEVFLLEPPPATAGAGVYETECLVRPGRRLAPGTVVDFGPDLRAEVVRRGEDGRRVVRFHFRRAPARVLEEVGRMPLPPYIKREPEAGAGMDRLDRERYQTVYADKPGAVAAPTAGLHFSSGLLAGLRSGGIETTALTLYVGYGTFAPVRGPDVTRHRLQAERVIIPAGTAAAVNRAKAEGRKVTAVGTTVVRSLEHAGRDGGRIEPFEGPVDLFIHPGFAFQVVDLLITNFHLPGSTLLMLVAALAGREFILEAYRTAVAEGYRFFSYGDAMLIR
ncbi:MAG: tRNA preQ1(34) S-adenosylmethionine ribosyltransferase-isomerase QueA [Thermodesulfobacteriota bacterium]